MQRDVRERFAHALCEREVSHALLMAMQRAPREGLERCVGRALGHAPVAV
jgi:hypothetical protein